MVARGSVWVWLVPISIAPLSIAIGGACSVGSSSSQREATATSTGSGQGGGGEGGGFSSSNGTGAGSEGGDCPPGTGGGTTGEEICGNGVDENGNGFIDEDCQCQPGSTQSCSPGLGGQCENKNGTQTCVLSGEFGQWGPCEGLAEACTCQLDDACEVCGNAIDDDCDGQVDEDCVIEQVVNIDGDCLSASCPPQAPYPIGCNIVMSGNDDRGCVANLPGDSLVYFQEGDNCGAGHVSGTLQCSSVQGPPLDDMNCAINKQDKYYPDDLSGCPDT
jgi:hypothetical protein